MPLVFVHGVSTRRDHQYNNIVASRDEFFRQSFLRYLLPDAAAVQIFNPYWGDHAARFAWEHASLPGQGIEHLGAVSAEQLAFAELVASFVSTEPSGSQTAVLVTVATKSFAAAVDLLFLAGFAQERRPDPMTRFVLLADRAAAYAEQNPHPEWLQKVHNNRDFVFSLNHHLQQWQEESIRTSAEPAAPDIEAGGRERLGGNADADFRELIVRVQSLAGNIVTMGILRTFRMTAHRATSQFLGDVLVYLKERGTPTQPGPIIQIVIDDLERAFAARTDNDPNLIVVAHSMGGNIMYDILSGYLSERKSSIEIDLLVTVGSQASVFQELDLFNKSYSDLHVNPPTERLPKPAQLKHWVNIFDPNDVLGFEFGRIFDGCIDYEYDTGSDLMGAHGSYFSRASFYRRLAARVKDLWK